MFVFVRFCHLLLWRWSLWYSAQLWLQRRGFFVQSSVHSQGCKMCYLTDEVLFVCFCSVCCLEINYSCVAITVLSECAHMHMQTHMHASTHTRTHTHTHTRTHTHTHTHYGLTQPYIFSAFFITSS